jgi:predicted GNAT superfamily acetyltransferase
VAAGEKQGGHLSRQAHRAEHIVIRGLTTHDELAEAVRLQKDIWGFEDIELLPLRLFVVATKVGGQVFGAFDGNRMIGFLLAIPGVKPRGGSYLHSHMMGVVTEYRDRGVGRLMKLRQREEALSRGVDLVEWTFDPLELKNAFFNIERLGAIIQRYVLNQYGTTSSHLHGGLPTDRCIAEWHLAHRWTEMSLAGTRPEFRTEARIEVPNDIGAIRSSQPHRAAEIQKRISDSFLEHFQAGLAVVGFERSQHSSAYLLGPWPSI